MTSVISNLIKSTSQDPDDLRRSNLLNIMLLGVAGISLIIIGVTLVTQIDLDVNIVLIGFVALILVLITYFINQYVSGSIASGLFLLSLTIVIAFSDEP